MTVPKWLIPVLATVAALAVGVAATLVAMRFAAPEDVRVAPTMIEVPVLAPVDESVPLEELVEGAGDELPVSPTVAIRESVDPGSVPEDALPADLAELLDELESADDPGDVIPPAAAPEPTEPPGDPCASTEAVGADCPEGAPGTILALGGELPPLQVWSTGGNDASCPEPDRPGSVRFWARANAPVTFEMRISQGDARRQTLETTEAQVAAWLADTAGGDAAWIEYCVEIDDLRGDVPVFVYLDATDELGRFATRALTIPVSDGLDVPPTRIHPIGDSTVFVSAAHRADEVLRTVIVEADREDPDPSCVYDGSRGVSRTVREPRTETLDAEYLAEHSYEPAYTRRTSAIFAVPPSTRMIVCVGWFPVSDSRPSFERDTPLRVSEYRMTSPDVVAPVITVSELVLTREVAEGGIRLLGSTENGQRCGAWSGPPRVSEAPNVVCDFGALLGWTDAGGALLVTTEVDTPSGEAVNHVLLDVGLLSCVDGCSGRTRSYDVPLSMAIRPGRLCSDDCFVGAGETAGLVRLRATWPASTAGTGLGWQLGEWREGPATRERDPLPQLDTTGEFAVAPSGDPADRSFSAAARLTVDRPVTAVAELWWSDPVPGLCPRPGGTTRWEGAGSMLDVRFDGLCAGTVYVVTLTLTAADGATSAYTYATPTATTRFWHGGSFSTPTQRMPVVVDEVRISTGDPDRVVALRSLRVDVGGIDARILLPAHEQRCWVGDVHGLRSGRSAAAAGELVEVRVVAVIRPGTVPAGTTTDTHPVRCSETSRSFADEERLEFVGWVSYEEFVAGPTVTVTDPETGYSATVVLDDSL